MDKKLVLGLDIGVGSVGWGIIEKDTGKIVDKGVRLFSEVDPENNAKRRDFRHTRRLIRRKEFRLYRTRRVLLRMGLIESIDFLPLNNPYEIRCKGLKEKLSNEELATAILHLMKRNGFRYDVADDEDSSGTKTIKEEYLCMHQLNELKENGKVRGTNNKYHFSLYEKEFLKLLDVQHIYGADREDLLKIFSVRRHFSEGPGSANSPSQYGRFLTLGAEPINLIEKMRGHCSIYPEELRAPKICPSAELHNFLNDLNNLKINGNHISTEKKNDIFETYILGKGKITIKQLEAFLGTSIRNIDGFRYNSKEEPIITEFKSLKKIKDVAKKASLQEFEINGMDDFYLLDKIFEILTNTKIVEERFNFIKDIIHDENYARAFANITGVSDYHSLSLKAIYELNNEMFETSSNSQQIICTYEKKFDNKELKVSDDLIASPVVYKSVNQTFKIIKAIEKKYGVLESVVIEMAREKNSQEEKGGIKKAQKRRLEEKEKVLEILDGHYNDTITHELIEKILLYLEQDCKSIYSGKSIDLNSLLANPSGYEIDHIIPYSISLDDSRANKVLVYASENQKKGQKSPYQMFNSDIPSDWWSFEDYESFVRNQYKGRKVENLLNKEDINNSGVREEFIQRNLNDTRYITREVLNTLKSYYSANNKNTKIFVINGATTNHVRRMAGLVKDRSIYSHHAVDALIIASFTKSTYLNACLNKGLYDEETGEVYSLKDAKQIFGPVIDNVCTQLINFDPIKDYKFSYKIDTKANRSLSDQTLYGTRIINGELYAVKKYKNIYDDGGVKLANAIKENKGADKLLICKNDPNTFALLCKIIKCYPNEENPFLAYYKEHNEHIKKVSKASKKAPDIVSIKYIEDKVNVHLDLSNKYTNPKQNKGYPTKLQLSPYRMDLYKTKDGKFKFVTIRYVDVRFKNSKYSINNEWYESEKLRKGIDDSYQFVNSYYRGDLIERKYEDGSSKLEVFKTVNNDLKGIVELEYYGKETMKENNSGELKKFQYTQSFTKQTIEINKFSTDILGNLFRVNNEGLKLEWK